MSPERNGKGRTPLGQFAVSDIPSLGIYRIVFALFTITLYWPQFRWMASVPDTLYQPPPLSMGAFLNGFPSLAVLTGLDLAILILTGTLLLGLATRTSSWLLFLCLLGGYQFQYSFGKIDHTILYLTTLPVLAMAGWGDAYSIDAARRRGENEPADDRSFGLWVLAVFIVTGFLAAGLPKLRWLDLDLTTSGALGWMYRGFYGLNREALLASIVADIDSALIWELVDYVTVAFEIGWLLALRSRTTWFLWLALGCAFHLANTLVLNIPFGIHSIVFLAFVPWSRIRGFRLLAGWIVRRRILVTCLAAGAAAFEFSNASGGLYWALIDARFSLVTWAAVWLLALATIIGTGPWWMPTPIPEVVRPRPSQ